MNLQDLILIHGDTSLKHIYDPSEYDPQAAHLYYERTKQLKGRKRGTAKPTTSGRHARAAKIINKHAAKKVAPKSAAQRRMEAEAKLPGLQAKLDQLRSILSELVRQAKERAGVDTSKETTSKNLTKDTKSSTTSTSSRDLTAQQKREAAKRSQEWRDAHQTPEDKAAALEQQIAEVTQKIKDMRAEAAQSSSTKPIHTKPDKAGRPPGDPHYGEDPPANKKPASSSVGARAKTTK